MIFIGYNLNTKSTADIIDTYYADSTITSTSTEAVQMTGFTKYDYDGGLGSDTLSLNVNRDTSEITGSFDTESISMGGTVENQSSYYINDDFFGVLISSGSYFESGTNLVEDSGWLVTIPDTLINGTYIETTDDESTWGYWTGTFDVSTHMAEVDYHSTWVAGVETSTSVIDDYLADNTVFSLSGHMIGGVKDLSSGDIDPILFDSNNFITLSFDFGSGSTEGSFDGGFGFNTAGQAWSGTIDDGTLTNSGFSSIGYVTGSEGISGDVIVSSEIEGKYYGTGSLKSVGGTFEFTTADVNEEETYTAFGSFKAGVNNGQ